MEGASAQGRIPSRPSFPIPSNVESFLCQRSKRCRQSWQVRIRPETVFLRFSFLVLPGNSQKIPSQKTLPNSHDSHQPKQGDQRPLKRSVAFLFRVPAVAAVGWFMASTNSAGMPYPNQPQQPFECPLAASPLDDAACVVLMQAGAEPPFIIIEANIKATPK